MEDNITTRDQKKESEKVEKILRAMEDNPHPNDNEVGIKQSEEIRNACKDSLWYLCTQVLGYKDWDMVHDDLEKFLVRPSKKKLVLVPRGHLKSAIVTKALTIQKLLREPDKRILIAHEVWDKSREMLSEVKEYLTTKSYLPVFFGDFVSDRWNADGIVIKQRKKALSAPSIGTTGVESEMTSTHFDDIVCDDLQGLQNVATKDQRDKVKRFLSSLQDLLEPGGTLTVVGTRWHEDDIYGHLLENEAEYYDVLVRRVVEDGKLIFPKKFSLRFDPVLKTWRSSQAQCMDYVDHLKKVKGSDFFAQYMNMPVSGDSQTFKRDYFKYWTRKPDSLHVVMTADFAITQKQESDFTALVVSGMDKDGNLYVLDYVRGKWLPNEIVKNVFQVQERWRPHVVGFESVGFQRTIKWAVEEEMRKMRRYFPIEDIKNGPQVSKEYRIKSLEPFYRSGTVFHGSWMKDKDLESELMTFPKGRHDDLVDALSMALPFMQMPQERVMRQDVPGTWDYIMRDAKRRNTMHDFFQFG